jgi:hypothetical protein
MREVFLEEVQLLLVVDVKLRRHGCARDMSSEGGGCSNKGDRVRRDATGWVMVGCDSVTAICGRLTGKKLSESSFCFANSFSSSSSMSNGTAPELRRAAELSPPRPPPKPPRPPRDIFTVCGEVASVDVV